MPERSRRARGRGRARRRADQRGARQDRRSPGAGRSRDRDRGPDQHRDAGARGAVRRVARLRQSAGIQRLHGRHRDHAAAASDPHLLHQPGDAERIERDPRAWRWSRSICIICKSVLVDPRRQARGDARAAHQPLCGDRDPVRARHAGDRDLARAAWRLRRCIASPASGSSRSTRTSSPTTPTRCSGRCPIAASRSTTSSSCRTRIRATGRAARATAARARPC